MENDDENTRRDSARSESSIEDSIVIGSENDPDAAPDGKSDSVYSIDSRRVRFSQVFDSFSSFFMRASETEDARSASETYSAGGINWMSELMAAMYIIGNSVGSFIFELPHALRGAGWFGVFLIIFCIVNSAYSGIVQTKCWIMIEEEWPQYKRRILRSPVPEMGYRVGGKWMKHVMSFLLIMNQVSLFLVKLFLLAKFIDRASFSVIPFCVTLILVTIFYIPFSLLHSPKNHKLLAILATVTSCCTIVLLCAAVIIDKKDVGKVSYRKIDRATVARAMGTIIVALNPSMIYPTLQQDMEARDALPATVIRAHIVILYLFLIFPILGYAAYGDKTPYDILKRFQSKPKLRSLLTTIESFLICELFATMVFQLTPVFLHLEDLLNIPENLTYKRVLLRSGVTGVLLLLLFNARFLASFMPFFRAFFTDFTSYMLPPIMYIALFRKVKTKKRIAKKEWFFMAEMFIFGIVAFFGSYLTADFHMRVKKQFGYNCYTKNDFLKYNFTIHG